VLVLCTSKTNPWLSCSQSLNFKQKFVAVDFVVGYLSHEVKEKTKTMLEVPTTFFSTCRRALV